MRNTPTWWYCTAKLGAIGLLVSCMRSVFHTARHLRSSHSLLVKVYQRASRRVQSLPEGLAMLLYGGAAHPSLNFEEAELYVVKENATTSTSYTPTTPGMCRQCSHRILRHEPTPAGSSYTVVWTSPTSHGRSFSLMKPSSQGKLFSIRASHVWASPWVSGTIPSEHLGTVPGWMCDWVISSSTKSHWCRVPHVILEVVPQHVPQNTWFQHDGAPPQISFAVRDPLDQQVGQQWIGCGGPIAWSVRSPDLTALDVGSNEILDLRDLCGIRGRATGAGKDCGGC